jgi:hypothetical protein
MDSLTSKLERLKNSWDTFTMGIVDNQIIKAGIDLLTGLMDTINQVIAFFDKFGMGGAASIGLIIAALYLGDKALKVFTTSLSSGGSILKAFGAVGKTAIDKLKNSFIGLQKFILKIQGKPVVLDTKPAVTATNQYKNAVLQAEQAEAARKTAMAGA